MASSEVYDKLRGEINNIFKEGVNLVEGDEFWLGIIADSEEPKRVLEIARDLKEEGNSLFKLGNFENALEIYGYAEAILGRYKFEEEVDKSEFCELALCILLNSTACFSKLKDFVQVGLLCSIILEFQPNNVKAMYRRAIAAAELGRHDMAYWDLVLATGIDPKNQDVIKKLEEIKEIIKLKKAEKQQQGTFPKGLGLGLPPTKKKSELELGKMQTSAQVEHQGMNSTAIPSEDDNREFPADAKDESDFGMNDNTIEESLMVSEDSSSITASEGNDKELKVIKDERMVDKRDEKSSFKEEVKDEKMDEKLSILEEDERMSSVCANEGDENPILAEPKYRFHNRRRHGSAFTISKRDYLLLSKQKKLNYFNAKSGTYMEVRIVNREEDSVGNRGGFIQQRVCTMKDKNQPAFDKALQDSEDSMKVYSEAHSCVTSEDDHYSCVESSYYSKDDEVSQSNAMQHTTFYFSAKVNSKPRRKSCATRKQTHDASMRNKRRRKTEDNKCVSPFTTNFCCGCRFVQDRKRKIAHPISMDPYHQVRKRGRYAPPSDFSTESSYCASVCNAACVSCCQELSYSNVLCTNIECRESVDVATATRAM